MRYMGIDYGDARVGVALSDPLGMMAQRFTTVQNTGGKKMFLQLAEIIKEKVAITATRLSATISFATISQ